MDSIEVSQDSQERSDLENVLLIGGTAMVLAGLFSWWRKKGPKLIPDDTDPPPIIIKSGSFVVESNDYLDEVNTGGGNYAYTTRTRFGKIVCMRVFALNDAQDSMIGYPFEDAGGHEVDIILQKYDSGTGLWVNLPDLVMIRTIGTAGNEKFRITMGGKKLHSKGKGRRHRVHRHMDNDSDTIRISEIIVRGPTTTRTFDRPDKSDYIITFYNHSV